MQRRRLLHTETHRTCYKCDEIKPNAAFTRRLNGSYFSACKACNVAIFAQARRARQMEAEGSFSPQEWAALLAQHRCCPECLRPWDEIPLLKGRGSAITIDHKIPLAKGGTNWITNLRPLCYSCNSRKGDRLDDDNDAA